MAFSRAGFRGIGGYNRGFVGGQRYSYVFTDDTLATIKTAAYFDLVANALGVNDLIDLVGSDGAETVKVFTADTTAGVTVVQGGSASTASLSGAGAMDPTASINLLTSTGADVMTMADGDVIGQTSLCVNIVDGGSCILTPATTRGTWSTITFITAGDAAELVWDGAGWTCSGVFGIVAPVVA